MNNVLPQRQVPKLFDVTMKEGAVREHMLRRKSCLANTTSGILAIITPPVVDAISVLLIKPQQTQRTVHFVTALWCADGAGNSPAVVWRGWLFLSLIGIISVNAEQIAGTCRYDSRSVTPGTSCALSCGIFRAVLLLSATTSGNTAGHVEQVPDSSDIDARSCRYQSSFTKGVDA